MQKKLLTKFNPFMVKTLQKVGKEGIYLYIINAIYDKATSNIILTGKRKKSEAINTSHFKWLRNILIHFFLSH